MGLNQLMTQKYDDNNVYALNVKYEVVHISEVESGQKGYFCLGCGKDLQAVKSKLENRIHYFRHAPTDVRIERKCTYSDETHRHKLAKEILARLKHIKVPAVYKYPPKDYDGLATLLKESVLIEAHSVEMERTFYEDSSGEIKWGGNHDVDEKHLLVKPDITFFDINKKPILFIELVVTHGVNAAKKAKLKRLGINTIQVKIPKDSPESIEKNFYSTERIKWIYNYDEECAKYIPIPNKDTTGIPSIDEEQRRLFAESFQCRQAQINNLIRTIKRILESKQYGVVEKGLRSELSRVEANTREHQSRLESIREEHRNRVIKQLEPRYENFKRETKQLEKEEREFEKHYNDLERRYFAKRKELEREEKKVDRELSGDFEDERGNGSSIEARRASIRVKSAEVKLAIDREETEIRRIEKELAGHAEYVRTEESSLTSRFERLTKETLRNIDSSLREMEELPARFDSNKGRITNEFRTAEEEARKGDEDLRRRINEDVMSRNSKGDSRVSRRIRDIFSSREPLKNIGEIRRLLGRIRKAHDACKNRDFLSWVD